MITTIKIQNLKCGGCANTIITKVSALENVNEVSVNVEDSIVTFKTLSEKEIENVKSKLSVLGYPEEGENNSVISKAKSYVSCATGKMSQ
jgi:copper chaperone CopZ